MKKVFIVLLNYNGSRDTVECLESVLNLAYPNFQIIVIDNSSDEDSIIYLKSWAVGEITGIESKYKDIVYPLESKPVGYKFYLEDVFEQLSTEIDEKLIFVKANENMHSLKMYCIYLR